MGWCAVCHAWCCGLRPMGCAVDGAVSGAVGLWRLCAGLGWLGDENKKEKK